MNNKKTYISRPLSRIVAVAVSVLFVVVLAVAFGGGFALDTISDAITYMVLVMLFWNLADKINKKQLFRISRSYWFLFALILFSDVAFYITSKGTTWTECGFRAIFFALILAGTIVEYELAYKKRQEKILEIVKEASLKELSTYLIKNGLDTTRANALAIGIRDLIINPTPVISEKKEEVK